MKTNLWKYVPLCIMLAMMIGGCAQNTTSPSGATTKSAVEQKQEANTYTGKIIGKSNKAKTISIEVGSGDKAKTEMVRFDDKTTGLDNAAAGEAAIITWEMRGSDKYATVIKPKLAKLPEGVLEIKPDEVKELLDKNTEMVIIDSRPEKRFAQSHLPGAISVTVEQMQTTAHELLPKEKDMLLVFYCGGYT